MRNSILEAHKQGTVIYGDMYLLEKLIDCDGRSFNMSESLSGASKDGKRETRAELCHCRCDMQQYNQQK